MAQPKRVCHYMELKNCVAKYMLFVMEFHSTETGETVECDCLQNCVDSNVYINAYKILEDTSELLGTIGGIVIIREYPLVRYKRKILFSLTDLFGKKNNFPFKYQILIYFYVISSIDWWHGIVFYWILCSWGN